MLALVVATLVFCVYAWTLSPAVGWLDSPEFVGASIELGVAHSPGHPLVTQLGNLGASSSMGDVVFGVNITGAVSGGLAAGAMALLCRELISICVPNWPNPHRSILSAAGGLLFAFTAVAWEQGTLAEVYSLQSFLLAAATASTLHWHRKSDHRYLFFSSFFIGLALANHNLTAAAFFIPAAIFVLARKDRPSFAVSTKTALFGIAGLLPLLYLPIRSLSSPLLNWGAPHTLDRFWWTVSVQAFLQATSERVSSIAQDSTLIVVSIFEHATFPLTVLALLAVVAAVKGFLPRSPIFFLFGGLLTSILARIWTGFDPETPDHHAYLLPGIQCTIAIGLVALAAFSQWLAERPNQHAQLRLPFFTSVLGVLLVIAQLAMNVGPRTERNFASEDVANWQLESLPQDSMVMLAYFQTSFRLASLVLAEGLRPDVSFLDRSLLTYPGAAENAKKRSPDLVDLIDAPLRAGFPTPTGKLVEIAQNRPVFFELHPNLERSDFSQLAPSGAWAEFAERWNENERQAQEQLHTESLTTLNTRIGSGINRTTRQEDLALFWYRVTALDFYCMIGRKHAAQKELAAAFSIAPGDETLAQMARDCSLVLPTRK